MCRYKKAGGEWTAFGGKRPTFQSDTGHGIFQLKLHNWSKIRHIKMSKSDFVACSDKDAMNYDIFVVLAWIYYATI